MLAGSAWVGSAGSAGARRVGGTLVVMAADTGEAPDGIVLAGGSGTRFGGDKTAATVGGRSLLGRAVQVLADAGAVTVVVVGPRLPVDVGVDVGCRLVLTREDPPGSGPVAGLLAGLAEVRSSRVLVLAADLPGVHVGVLRDLLAALGGPVATDGPGGADAAVAADAGGRAQWLTAAYRTTALLAACEATVAEATARPAGARGPSLKAVVARLRWVEVPARPGWGRLVDVDTPQDLTRARLDDWTAQLIEELALAPALEGTDVQTLVDLVLDLAKDAAHTVARPAAPLTTFALGLAAGLQTGRGDGGTATDLASLRGRIEAMLQDHGER